MILNIRVNTKHSNVIIHCLSKNKDKYNKNFHSTVFNFTSMTPLLSAIKTVITGKDDSISAEEFLKLIETISVKRYFPASISNIICSINSEASDPLVLSRLYIDKGPIPKIKCINIINDKIYFMIRTYPSNNYDLELVEHSRFDCIVPKNSISNLYRAIKKTNTKQPKTKTISEMGRDFADNIKTYSSFWGSEQSEDVAVTAKNLFNDIYTKVQRTQPPRPSPQPTYAHHVNLPNSTVGRAHRYMDSTNTRSYTYTNTASDSETGVEVSFDLPVTEMIRVD